VKSRACGGGGNRICAKEVRISLRSTNESAGVEERNTCRKKEETKKGRTWEERNIKKPKIRKGRETIINPGKDWEGGGKKFREVVEKETYEKTSQVKRGRGGA